LTKHRRKKKRGTRRRRQPGQPTAKLERTFRRADRLIGEGQATEALALLEPLLGAHPRQPDLHYLLGYARATAGDLWGALAGYERAQELSRDPAYWIPLATLYGQLGLRTHALRAFRQILRHRPDGVEIDLTRETADEFELGLQMLAERLGLAADRVEKGLRYHELGQRALNDGEYRSSITANRRARKLLADWPPCLNNLSLGLFFEGQPEEAITTTRRVLDRHPDNIQALSNAIQFLTWTGAREEAETLWAHLRELEPEDDDARLKAADAAAAMEDDEAVVELLKPVAGRGSAKPDSPGLDRRARFFLAVAETNLGRRAARRRLRGLLPERPWLVGWLQALQKGRPGPGRAERFPYFQIYEMLPARQMERFLTLLGREDGMAPVAFEKQVTRFVKRFPQIVLLAEKLIWEDIEADGGMLILQAVDTVASRAALRRFGLSQAGDAETRMQALYALAEMGEIAPDETLRFWEEGAWRDIQVRHYEITDEPTTQYPPEVEEVLYDGLEALQQGDLDQAEELLRHMLALEPRAKDAYNNLGTIYARRGEMERAQEMFRAALEIDPLYVFPRCNLVPFLLDEDDVEGAREMLKPLDKLTRFHPLEMASFFCAQARISMHQGELEEARTALEQALELWPDHAQAEGLLERLDAAKTGEYFDSWFERQHRRDQAWRVRLQARLTTPNPTLAETLPLLTKEALTGTAWEVLPWGGWSALRKAELIERLIGGLTDPANVARMVQELDDEQQAALRKVLDHGGHMPWQGFDAAYGNDLDESRYWQWHEPRTTMGCLRRSGLLAEATVDGELIVAVPVELRQTLKQALSSR
jgi:tetratricopeptide (TPR) repeat protein